MDNDGMTIEEAIECFSTGAFVDLGSESQERAQEAHSMALSALRTQQEAESLRRERDAAISDIKLMGGCPICKHNVGRSDRTGLTICEKKREYPSTTCFEWRGLQEQEAEKNEQLTLEELQQMDGQPVYVVWDGHGEHWALVHGFWKSEGVAYLTYSNGASDLIEILLNEGAKIYRHPPKEEPHGG